MNVALALMFYGSVVAGFGPPVLRVLTRHGAAPRLGVLAWLVAIASALSAWVLAAGLLIFEFATFWRHPSESLRDCYSVLFIPMHLHGHFATRMGTLALSALVAGSIAAMLVRAIRAMLRMRRRTYAHGRAVRMVGRSLDGDRAVVLESQQRQAYCVVGRPNTIVVTSAAVDALTAEQLDAVLAHEHAHLIGRHAALTGFLRGIAATLPVIRLVTDGTVEIARLLEMCADDSAVRRYGPEPLLGGLLALVAEPVPAGAFGAAGTAVLDRAERLATPVGAVRRATNRTALLAVIAATLIGLLEVAVGVLFGSMMIG